MYVCSKAASSYSFVPTDFSILRHYSGCLDTTLQTPSPTPPPLSPRDSSDFQEEYHTKGEGGEGKEEEEGSGSVLGKTLPPSRARSVAKQKMGAIVAMQIIQCREGQIVFLQISLLWSAEPSQTQEDMT